MYQDVIRTAIRYQEFTTRLRETGSFEKDSHLSGARIEKTPTNEVAVLTVVGEHPETSSKKIALLFLMFPLHINFCPWFFHRLIQNHLFEIISCLQTK